MTYSTDTPQRSKRRAALLSVFSNTFLVLGKLFIGLLTGSVAVVSEAVHSAMDLLAAVIAFFAVNYSGRPPDLDHPHGHGKMEQLSGAVEALLIFGAVLFIGYEAIEKLIQGSQVRQIYLGAIVMGVSALVNTVVSWHLQRVATFTDSDALLADAAHLRTDVYTSLGVLAGLLLVHFTGVQWLDPAVALGVALLIVREAWLITRRSVGGLLDESLPQRERALVEGIIAEAGLKCHALRSRKSGPTRKIDLHLDVNPKATAEQIHRTCDRLEAEIAAALPGAQVLIHPEPQLELDNSRTVQLSMEQILERHRTLFIGHSDLHTYESDDGVHISLRLQLPAAMSVQEADHITRHLSGHITRQVPRAHVYIQIESATLVDQA